MLARSRAERALRARVPHRTSGRRRPAYPRAHPAADRCSGTGHAGDRRERRRDRAPRARRPGCCRARSWSRSVVRPAAWRTTLTTLLTVFALSSELLLLETGLSRNGSAFVADIGEAEASRRRTSPGSFSFSRQDILEPRVLDLADLADESLRLLRRLIQRASSLPTCGEIRRACASTPAMGAGAGEPRSQRSRRHAGRWALAPGDRRLVQSGDDACFLRRAARDVRATQRRRHWRWHVARGCESTSSEPFFTTKPRHQGRGSGSRWCTASSSRRAATSTSAPSPGRAPRSASWCR